MSKHPITERRLVMRTPAMDTVVVNRDVPFGDDTSPNLRMDIYRPAEGKASLPVVILVTGYSDIGSLEMLGCNLKDMAAYIDWAQLIASCGMLAITYKNEKPIRDIDLLFSHIKDNAELLGIDTGRIGLWSSSGNVPNALAFMQKNKSIRCAVLCYGYMLDTDGKDDVARAAEQWGFVAPIVEMKNRQNLAHIPTLIVRAGLDDMPGLNKSIDRYVAQALQANYPVTVANQSTGQHGFDVFDPSEHSRVAIRQILWHLSVNLLE